MSENIAESDYPRILREAADHIEKVGLNKDGGFFEGVDPELVNGVKLADLPADLDEEGWFRDAYPDYDKIAADLEARPVVERPCCTLGAVQAVIGADHPFELSRALDARIQVVQGRPEGVSERAWGITEWNDREERTPEDVTRFLRETADELEQQAGGN